MRPRHRSRASFILALVLVAGLAGASKDTRAQALVTQGVGTASCAKLGPDLRPAEGLNRMPNALLFYWIQGYVSAANIYLLNKHTSHIDMRQVDSDKLIRLVAQFCTANPDQKPISAIDKFIRVDSKKIEVKESEVFDPWEH